MPDHALVLGDKELRPLVEVPSQMDGAIDTLERATVDYYQGSVREHNLVDRTAGTNDPNLLQIHFAADDGLAAGFQMFAETRDGPALPNARFVALLDPKTRQLLALVDYWSLNPLRVGASAGLGCRYMAPDGARVAGILGSSKQARAQLQAIQRSVPTLERARVYSPTREHRESFAREMTDWLDLPVEAVGSAQEATTDADIVGLANNSRQPVLDLSWVKTGALVISIGGGQLPSEVMDGPRVVATTWESLATREPYATRVKAGTYSKDDVAAELGALILGEASVRESSDQTVIFELTRLNIWAVSVANWAYQWAVKEGIGTAFAISGGR
jgi:alanine dehydrogenase